MLTPPFENQQEYVTADGDSYPLGATCVENGVNFALFSAHATRVELCLFDDLGRFEIARLSMTGYSNQVWHLFVEGLGAGALYGYRVYGPYEPQRGHRFNPAKLMLDPYARQLDGVFHWSDHVFSYEIDSPYQDLVADTRDNAPDMPKCVVVSAEQLKLDDLPEPASNKPRTPWHRTVVYETHVKGFTQLNLSIPAHDRGTYAGMAHPESVRYLKQLGITAVELLPVHGFVDEQFLVNHGLSNYWGYNTLNFFAAHGGYLGSGDPREFKRMVSALHEAGIEVILDVVYNHTAEGNHLGPTLCFRGIDNASYYALQSHEQRFYTNDTGCGNTFNLKHPRVLQLVMDSLRYWATEMGVDGFRFDLATVLGRESYGFDPGSGFFDALRQDPALARCKLIAEPWDIGPGGYQLGNYPSGWAEWNDRYRDTVRRFWKGDPGVLPEFARRIHGSSDLFEHSGRAPSSSINFITSHDGFTLHDLVTYRDKHNERNKEQNRDGHHANFSENYGIEGESPRTEINELRKRQQRNFLATLFLSQGTPMLLGGDEISRTQQGNNNAYCQDNDINWFNWQELTGDKRDLMLFVRYVLSIRRQYPLLTSKRYIHRPDEPDDDIKCVVRWVSSSGEEMRDSHWTEQYVSSLGWILEQYPVEPAGAHKNGERVHTQAELEKLSCRILILFNSGAADIGFRLPSRSPEDAGVEVSSWDCILDTWYPDGVPKPKSYVKGATVKLRARSLQLLVATFE